MTRNDHWRDVYESYVQFFGREDRIVSWVPISEYEITIELDNGEEHIYNDATKTIQNITNRDALEDVYSEERFNRELAYAIYSRMIYLNVSQEQLACSIGVSQGTISNYVNGVSAPNIYTLYLIAKFLNCNVRDFLKFIEL